MERYCLRLYKLTQTHSTPMDTHWSDDLGELKSKRDRCNPIAVKQGMYYTLMDHEEGMEIATS